jgi:RluA family pseudouridine synthase
MNDVIKLSSPATREFWEIPVLFEDSYLLALDKPSGLLTSPDRDQPERSSLIKLLHRDIGRGAHWVQERRISYLANAHRLDEETSGVMLLAKDKTTLIALANQFGSQTLMRSYVALVQGRPAENTFRVDTKVAPDLFRPGIVRVDQKRGRKAETRFEVLERFKGYALVKCEPFTERTHQIRVHLQSQGLPIVGDSLYGSTPLLLSNLKSDYRFKPGREERPLVGHTALHLEKLALLHPSLGTPVQIESPWPKLLKVAVKYLRKYTPVPKL